MAPPDTLTRTIATRVTHKQYPKLVAHAQAQGITLSDLLYDRLQIYLEFSPDELAAANKHRSR